MFVYQVIGLMSGSSLDGLDVCYVEFIENQGKWSYEIKATQCFSYTSEFQNVLRNLPNASAYELAKMHTQFSRITAENLEVFFQNFPESKNASLIVSHGQTIFHQPEKSFTTQIGCGATLSALTGKAVVCDLRTFDVALGGQGAPLVPFGEKYLFTEFSSFLNIGGICNVSFHKNEQIKAYDVCPGNTLLNLLAMQTGNHFDADGNLARAGKVSMELLYALSAIEYFDKPFPKSLGTEHIMEDWWRRIDSFPIAVEDKLATVVEHIALELSKVLGVEKVYATGGGVINRFLLERIVKHSLAEIVVPDRSTIEFKESLIIAFVGLMRYLGRDNFLSSVTGSKRNNMGGAIYGKKDD